MKFTDIGKAKKQMDSRAENDYDIKPHTLGFDQTNLECIDRSKGRMKTNLTINTLERSFEQALRTAEGTEIFTVWEKGDTEEWNVILSNIKQDWQQDVKNLNAPIGKGFEVGNVITWKRLNMKWLIFWQDYNINEFFKGQIRRANYIIYWKNEFGKQESQWVAVQGPIETRAKYEQTRGNAIVGRANDSIEIWMGSNTGKNIEAIKRYKNIKVGGRTWRIQVVDDISNPDILRLSCVEDGSNEYTDLELIPAGKIDFAENEVLPDKANVRIVGKSFINEKLENFFFAINEKTDERLEGEWIVDNADFKVLEDGQVSIKGPKIGTKVKIKFISPIGENEIELKTVSMLR